MIKAILFVAFAAFVVKVAFGLLPKYKPQVVNPKNPYSHIMSKDLIVKLLFELKNEKMSHNERALRAKALDERLKELMKQRLK